jgi:hypothetical protein
MMRTIYEVLPDVRLRYDADNLAVKQSALTLWTLLTLCRPAVEGLIGLKMFG